MITNISRQLTTGVLAIAGSVAAFGFGGIAQAQTTANATFGGSSGGVTFTGDLSTATSITFNSLTGVVSDVPANYTPFGGTPATNVFNLGPAGTTFLPLSGFNVAIAGGGNTLDFTGAGASNSTEGITLNFASSTTPANRYTFTAGSGRITSQNAFGVIISFLGSFADSGGSFSTSAATATLSIASSGPNAGTNTFTFGTPPAFASTSVPEPSAILGILAVAGIGAFARRKS